MREHIDSCHKESERYTAYPEQITAHFEDIVSITVDSSSVNPQDKQNSNEEGCQINTHNKNEIKKSIEENSSRKK